MAASPVRGRLELPEGAWNSHVHCFDPERHPFKPTRAYTPQPATAASLTENALTTRIMIVQATIEDDPASLLANLDQCRAFMQMAGSLIRGTIFADPTAKRPLETLSRDEFDDLHRAGIRSVRIHGSYGGAGDDIDWVLGQLQLASGLYSVKHHKWSISAQLPLQTWTAIAPAILNDAALSGVTFVADHNACATPRDADAPELKAVLGLMASGRLYVKLGALHRRAPDDVHRMRPIVQAFAAAAADRILWGSDWPHCDATKKGLVEAPPLQGVDTVGELEAMASWLSQDQFHAMMVANPNRLWES